MADARRNRVGAAAMLPRQEKSTLAGGGGDGVVESGMFSLSASQSDSTLIGFSLLFSSFFFPRAICPNIRSAGNKGHFDNDDDDDGSLTNILELLFALPHLTPSFIFRSESSIPIIPVLEEEEEEVGMATGASCRREFLFLSRLSPFFLHSLCPIPTRRPSC